LAHFHEEYSSSAQDAVHSFNKARQSRKKEMNYAKAEQHEESD
jgi:hypothetical protein